MDELAAAALCYDYDEGPKLKAKEKVQTKCFTFPYPGRAYDEAMDALSSTITKKSRSRKPVSDHRFERVFDYVKILDLEK
ncbi:folylpolyglutamate synthase-like [Helianthus annuus]|uniref:folylpolyglutamate synthase-like n=1 Tax=Helianthus annuus TaxID=4232 RepID=UPI000B903952|nr:folylpolyglutamate synthase-like [Helianthus annuus]